MVANFVAGGAAINVLARQAGATRHRRRRRRGLRPRRARPGRRAEPAAPQHPSGHGQPGRRSGHDRGRGAGAPSTSAPRWRPSLVRSGARALVTGEMGIGNTTPSAALIAALVGSRPRPTITGRGTGIDDVMLARKVAVVERALARLPAGADPVRVLAEVGGLEIAGLAGFIVGGASHRVPGGRRRRHRRRRPPRRPRAVPGGAAVRGRRPPLDRARCHGRPRPPRAGAGARPRAPARRGVAARAWPSASLEAAALILQEMATFDGAAVKDAR